MATRLLCQSCGEQKMSLQRVKSSLIKSMEVVMCASCIGDKYEPRFIIILAARSFGMNEIIKKIIVDDRYLGERISATDIL